MNWSTIIITLIAWGLIPTNEIIQDNTISHKITINESEIIAENGSISGKIKYAKGFVRNQLSVIKDERTCGGKPLIDESLLTSEDGGLQWAVVSIEGEIEGGKSMDCAEKKVLNQVGCTFEPHVIIVGKGCPLTIQNSDKTLHNVRTKSFMNDPVNKLQMFIPGQPAASDDIIFEETEVVNIVCDVHGWMNSFVHVVENAYNEVSDEAGVFTMTDVPAGKHTLKVWHEKLGELTQTVEVKAGVASEIVFIFE